MIAAFFFLSLSFTSFLSFRTIEWKEEPELSRERDFAASKARAPLRVAGAKDSEQLAHCFSQETFFSLSSSSLLSFFPRSLLQVPFRTRPRGSSGDGEEVTAGDAVAGGVGITACGAGSRRGEAVGEAATAAAGITTTTTAAVAITTTTITAERNEKRWRDLSGEKKNEKNAK